MKDQLKFKNIFNVECRDKDGNLKWTREARNLITDEGMNYLLDTGLANNDTAEAAWFISLIKGDGTFTAVATTDTAAGIDTTNGWEEDQGYTESPRPTWGVGAAAARSVTNATAEDFSITGANRDIQGIFVISNSTKGGTTGTLWAATEFSSVAGVQSGDTLKITYTVNG